MPKTENVVASARLQEVAERRAGLRATMAEVEKAASAALVGRPGEWGAALSPHIDDLRTAWASHVSGTEGPGGLWEQIRTDAPRLEGALHRLGRRACSLDLRVGGAACRIWPSRAMTSPSWRTSGRRRPGCWPSSRVTASAAPTSSTRPTSTTLAATGSQLALSAGCSAPAAFSARSPDATARRSARLSARWNRAGRRVP